MNDGSQSAHFDDKMMLFSALKTCICLHIHTIFSTLFSEGNELPVLQRRCTDYIIWWYIRETFGEETVVENSDRVCISSLLSQVALIKPCTPLLFLNNAFLILLFLCLEFVPDCGNILLMETSSIGALTRESVLFRPGSLLCGSYYLSWQTCILSSNFFLILTIPTHLPQMDIFFSVSHWITQFITPL